MAENATTSSAGMRGLISSSDFMVPGLILAVIAFMLIPLPSWILDFGLVLNLLAAVVVLLMTLYTTETLAFSSFPSLLLISTLVRVALNVAATRLILANGDAGKIIQVFGSVVGGNDPVVGLVVFIILVVIQFVVITSGAQRVSEVAARFTLDAMPGKQMAIDADLNSGLINEIEARARREKIQREANFYGAMDGASKFVRGDAIASIIIVVVNILGGFIIGFASGRFATWQEVLQTYTILTIGAGLVTQMSALLIATATGLLVTRSASESNMGKEMINQLTANARPFGIAAVALAIMGIFAPGWSRLPILIVAAIAGLGYYLMAQTKEAESKKQLSDAALKPLAKEPENVTKLLSVDPMELEIGFGLIALVEEAQGGDLLDRITMIRRQTAVDMGVVVPPIRIRDNMQLASEGYSIKIRGTEVAKGELMTGRFLAINSSGRPDSIPGTKTKEPTFGLPALWIEETQKAAAERQGYTVVDLPSVIATHLTEVIRSHAAELITRQDVQKLVDTVRQSNAAVVEELLPSMLSLGDVQKVLQNLLRERVSIRDLNSILETLADHARVTKDTDALTEHVRQALYRTITKTHLSPDNAIHAITLDPRLEQTLISSVHRGEGGAFLALEPRTAQRIITALSKQIEGISKKGYAPLVLCSPMVRLYFKRLVEKLLPNLTVLSYSELDPKTEIQSSGSVNVSDENTTI
jgi:flagellar biosynthesis protein FlhA